MWEWIQWVCVMQESQTPTYERPTDWVNYGDVNPEPHGGLFVKWDGSMWKLVRTYPAVDRIADYDGPETDQYIEVGWVEPMDIWIDGEPSEGFTQQMEQRVNELAEPSIHPEAPSLMENIGRYAGLLEGDVRMEGEVEEMSDFEDYEDIVASYGVDSWE